MKQISLVCGLLVAACTFGDAHKTPPDGGGSGEPVACTQDSDCSNACATAAACELSSHTCVFSQPVEDHFPCGAASECHQGQCFQIRCGDGIQQAGEACDDGNQHDGDGCDNDCTFSCVTASDCAPADACSTAVCSDTHTCVAGPPVACSDGDSCTADSCDSGTGCQHAMIDQDGDGYGPGSACGGDCSDTTAAAHPGQTDWFTIKIPSAPAASDFDYNCDSVETKHFTQGSECQTKYNAFQCNMASNDFGWLPVNGQAFVPACGASAQYSAGCYWDGTYCQAYQETKTQECH